MLKHLPYSIICLLVVLCGWQSTHATHVMGADLAYSCVNNCTIQVELKAYLSCSGSAGISPVPFQFVPPVINCMPPVAINNWPPNAVVTELSPLCSALSPTNCTDPNSSVIGVEEYYFTRQYDVCAAGACIFDMEWNTCCRTPGITNIANAGSQGIVIGSMTFNNTLPTCNSSPVFSSQPPPFICAGQTTILPMGATDPDGDSLSFSLGTCYNTSMQDPVSYNAGYSATQPFGPSWNVSIDPDSGDITLTAIPGNVEVGNICVYVEEYRNGQLINTIMRDYAVTIVNCPSVLCNGSNYATGTVYRDNNSNCSYDAGDVPMFNRQVLVLPDSVILQTDMNGEYHIYPDSGTYTLEQLPDPYGLWNQTCPVSLTHTITFPGSGDTIAGNDFGNAALYTCPQMWVDIGSNLIRPCFNNYIYVSYCNNGTDTAYNAFIDVTLDTNFTYLASTIPLAGSNGGVHTFNLGTVPPGHCGSFNMTTNLNCDTTLIGNTFCHEAHIYPDSICSPVNPLWDSSHVEVLGYCDDDSLVCFTAYNTGGSNMAGPTDWRLFENGTLIANGTLQLCSTCDTMLCFPANGNTMRMEVDQRPGHPSISTPAATVEQCGVPNSVNNMVNILPEPDADLYVSIHCGPAVAAYDPNSKQVYPAGVDAAYHYIDSTDVLEYMIDFQNEGTAAAIRVELTDTLSTKLDITSIVPGVSSHDYTWQVLSGRRLRFTFDNINLPPKSQDSVASIGFVKFKIKQLPGNAMGTRIENAADIVFDYNAAIRTNTVFNTIGWPVQTSFEAVENDEKLRVYPNPSRDRVFVEAEGMENGRQLRFELFNIMGKRVLKGDFEVGKRLELEVGQLPVGVYVYRVVEGGRMLKAGKLLIQ